MRKLLKKVVAFVATAALATGICGAVFAEDTYSVIGTINGNWDTDTDLVAQGDGTYSATIENVAAGDYEYKIRTNHEWDNGEYGPDGEIPKGSTNNPSVTVDEDGSSVVFTFDGEKVSVMVLAPGVSLVSSSDTTDTTDTTATTAPQTGDATPFAVAVVAMVAMGAAVVALNTKKAR